MAKLTGYDKGFRDGYLEGLEECGPITGLTRFFDRRGKTKKLSAMKDEERMALIAEAMAEYEAEASSAKKRIFEQNPSAAHHKMVAKMKRDQARHWMRKAMNSRAVKDRFVYAVGAFQAAAHAVAHDASRESQRVQNKATKVLANVVRLPPDYLAGLVVENPRRRKPMKKSSRRRKNPKNNPKKTVSVRSLVSKALK